MHRMAWAAVFTVATTVGGLAAAIPASAAPAAAGGPPGNGWFQVVETAFDRPAGVECAFPIHAEPTVNQVFGKTTRTYPDGTPAQQIFTGPLVFRVTNTDNGKYYDADASGSAVVDYATDTTQTWHVIGPILLNSRAGRTNLPLGLWVVNGIYRLVIDPTPHVTVTLVVGTEDNVCDHIA